MVVVLVLTFLPVTLSKLILLLMDPFTLGIVAIVKKIVKVVEIESLGSDHLKRANTN